MRTKKRRAFYSPPIIDFDLQLFTSTYPLVD
jgi:hypothetical protein